MGDLATIFRWMVKIYLIKMQGFPSVILKSHMSSLPKDWHQILWLSTEYLPPYSPEGTPHADLDSENVYVSKT